MHPRSLSSLLVLAAVLAGCASAGHRGEVRLPAELSAAPEGFGSAAPPLPAPDPLQAWIETRPDEAGQRTFFLLPDSPAEREAIEVVGIRPEETPVGPYGQPDWTTQRRFARSRVYVLAPGQWEAEVWYRGKYEDGDNESRLYQAELGVGLPYRFQLDYYHNFTDSPDGPLRNAGPQVELRYALADWGEIPLNPTLYLEYRWDLTGADKVEAKALLGDAIAPGWHAAANLIVEQQTSGERETELGVSAALSYSVIDGTLGVGIEATVSRLTANGSRGDDTWEAALGPSLQWRFLRNAHLDIVPMFGLNDEAPDLDLFIVLGYDFGGAEEGVRAPTSTRSR